MRSKKKCQISVKKCLRFQLLITSDWTLIGFPLQISSHVVDFYCAIYCLRLNKMMSDFLLLTAYKLKHRSTLNIKLAEDKETLSGLLVQR